MVNHVLMMLVPIWLTQNSQKALMLLRYALNKETWSSRAPILLNHVLMMLVPIWLTQNSQKAMVLIQALIKIFDTAND